MKLSKMPLNRACRVIGIDADSKTKARLGCLGVRWGTKLAVISRAAGGALLMRVKGRRVAIGPQVAAMIIVMEL